MHSIRAKDGTVIRDWLWMNERDAVNIIVRKRSDQPDGEGRFLVFRQTKYGVEGETFAPVGGYIENGEAPQQAARREVNEEMGLVCTRWTPLGRFRTAVNRGGGFTHTYFADDCHPLTTQPKRRSDDLEKQSLVSLTQEDLLRALQDGRFVEVKWTATIALALIRIRGEGAGK